jgi:benzoyl-CoA reductase/2-hydroxyglutaryl-CoA dehydratase subunit BcrC/BadD/HgdB
MILAVDGVSVGLCAGAEFNFEGAENLLPRNLCPLIKSAFGFKTGRVCPYIEASDVIVGENTCDGKKKSYEILKPMHVMDLPQLPDEPEALENWTTMIRKLQRFLESVFEWTVTNDQIEQAIYDTNEKSRRMNEIFDYAVLDPPVIAWSELYDAFFLGQAASGREMRPILDMMIEKLERRKLDGYTYGPKNAPRVMVTGCPVAGDSLKVLNTIEEVGGVIVALDSCSGMKPDFLPDKFESGTSNAIGLAGLAAGLRFLLDVGVEQIRKKETQLTRLFLSGAAAM